MIITALAPAKVNLSLFLGPVRNDGRHELVTLFESLSLADELTLSTLGDAAGGDVVECPGVAGENLVSKALAGLRRRGWDAPGVHIEIRKRIPVAAGMGGGSADAAAALRLAAELAPGRPEEVAALAAELGADVPSQLAPGLALGTGAGEVVERFEPLAPHALVAVPQPVMLSTAAVYQEADRLGLLRTGTELRARYEQLIAVLEPGAVLPAEVLVNDLEPATVSLCPVVRAALDDVRDAGADTALVCGSGPTVAGLFWEKDAVERAEAAARQLRGRYPQATSVTPVDATFSLPQIS